MGNSKDQYGDYKVTGAGTNSQGNIYVKTQYSDAGHTNNNTYKYINQNGSSYSNNPDGTASYNPPQKQK
ncbi:hypothetical protein SCHPADRAFT_946679 [Schizopora paradoxa]|uniref:Uncharacterized protein n=1 Tax=Schizopora paradoxa TaxID=27342 RepID=A0A0H2R2Z0_9AGAM|nr:hypothetical protein SCHPADRAFT_946679 [Schizopora paradoxa]